MGPPLPPNPCLVYAALPHLSRTRSSSTTTQLTAQLNLNHLQGKDFPSSLTLPSRHPLQHTHAHTPSHACTHAHRCSHVHTCTLTQSAAGSLPKVQPFRKAAHPSLPPPPQKGSISLHLSLMALLQTAIILRYLSHYHIPKAQHRTWRTVGHQSYSLKKQMSGSRPTTACGDNVVLCSSGVKGLAHNPMGEDCVSSPAEPLQAPDQRRGTASPKVGGRD